MKFVRALIRLLRAHGGYVDRLARAGDDRYVRLWDDVANAIDRAGIDWR